MYTQQCTEKIKLLHKKVVKLHSTMFMRSFQNTIIPVSPMLNFIKAYIIFCAKNGHPVLMIIKENFN